MSGRFGSGVLVVALVAAAVSGCGSDDESTARPEATEPAQTAITTTDEVSAPLAWAEGLCTTLETWQESVKSASAKMANSQADFAEAAQAITAAGNALVQGLNELDTPSAPVSRPAADAVDGLSTELQQTAAEIEQALLGVSTQSEIVTATARVGALISQMNSAISETGTQLRYVEPTIRGATCV